MVPTMLHGTEYQLYEGKGHEVVYFASFNASLNRSLVCECTTNMRTQRRWKKMTVKKLLAKFEQFATARPTLFIHSLGHVFEGCECLGWEKICAPRGLN